MGKFSKKKIRMIEKNFLKVYDIRRGALCIHTIEEEK